MSAVADSFIIVRKTIKTMIKSHTVKIGVKPVRIRDESILKDSKSLKFVKSSANTEKIS